ncbi:MAG: FkbM family methyltransferase, partial [Desulfovibrio sp.]
LGYFSCLAAAAGAEVFSIEMQRSLLPLIEENARFNGMDQVHVISAAVSDEVGFLSYHRRGQCPGKRVQESCAEGHTYINAVTLDSLFLDEKRPDVLKIDVEGFESKVLAGAKQLLSEVGPMLFLEIHPAKIEGYGFSLASIHDMLKDAGYTIQLLKHRIQEKQLFIQDRAAFCALTGNPMAVCTRE